MRNTLRAIAQKALLVVAVLMVCAVIPVKANATPLISVYPGAYLSVEHSNGERSRCTAGPAVSLPSSRPGNKIYGVLTAGHCGEDGDRILVEVRGTKQYVGKLTDPVDTVTDGVRHDYGVIILANEIVSPVVAGNLPPKTFLTSDEVKKGMNVCSYGDTSGERCGPVKVVDPYKHLIQADFQSKSGDSGGPVYAKNSSGEIAYIGLLRGHRDDTGYSVVVPMELVINEYGLKVLLP